VCEVEQTWPVLTYCHSVNLEGQKTTIDVSQVPGLLAEILTLEPTDSNHVTVTYFCDVLTARVPSVSV
jgi:hypothetical protein